MFVYPQTGPTFASPPTLLFAQCFFRSPFCKPCSPDTSNQQWLLPPSIQSSSLLFSRCLDEEFNEDLSMTLVIKFTYCYMLSYNTLIWIYEFYAYLYLVWLYMYYILAFFLFQYKIWCCSLLLWIYLWIIICLLVIVNFLYYARYIC